MLQLIYVFIVLLLSALNVFGQTPNAYSGTWRWIGNQRDTFIIVLQQEKHTQTHSSDAETIKFLGKHSYSKDGKLVESNLYLYLNSLSDTISIVGDILAENNNQTPVLSQNISFQKSTEKDIQPLQIGIKEIIRKQIFYFGTMQIIKGEVNKAKWIVQRERPDIIVSKDQRDLTPLIPSNIILEKISN